MTTDKRLSIEDLSPDQLHVYEAIVRWAENPHGVLTVAGLAGCGKTTLLSIFASENRKRTAYVTFTGRASSVLQRKLKAAGVKTTGFDAPSRATVGTLHQLLYMPVIDEETEERTGWHKREKLSATFDLIAIDEASMVSGPMLADIQAHGVPILAVGDHGQLPPVMDSGDLMRDPDLKLEKIHRQAEGDPIIKLAHIVRATGRLDRTLCTFRRKFEIDEVLREAYAGVNPMDVGVICYTNRIRIWLNGKCRTALGFEGPMPRAGEIVMCLKNDPPVYNGMRGVLETDASVGSKLWLFDAEVGFPEEGLGHAGYSMCAATFNRERIAQTIDELRASLLPFLPDDSKHTVERFSEAGHPYDFGYAMTVHKSQGSSFRHVIFFLDRLERPDDDFIVHGDWRRFCYTAVTRASTKLTVVA